MKKKAATSFGMLEGSQEECYEAISIFFSLLTGSLCLLPQKNRNIHHLKSVRFCVPNSFNIIHGSFFRF